MEPCQSGSFQASQENLAHKSIVLSIKDHCLVKVQHMIIWIKGAVIHCKRRNDESARRLIVQNMLAQGKRKHVVRSLDRGIRCCMRGGERLGSVRAGGNGGAIPPNRVAICSGANSERGMSLLVSFRIRRRAPLIAQLDW